MKKNLNKSHYCSNPQLRLLFTVSLGFLGATLLPVQPGFAINIFGAARRMNLLSWLVILMLGILIFYYLEKIKPNIIIYTSMVLSLIVPFLFFPELEKKQYSIVHMESFYWQCGIFFSLILAGGIAKIISMRILNPLIWIRELFRGLAIAMLAPLLLFASYSIPESNSLTFWQRVSKKAFFLFPFVMLLAYIFPFFMEMIGFWHKFIILEMLAYYVPKDFPLRCISFTIWAWIGCALMFALSPWSEYPQISKSTILLKRKILSLLSILVTAMLMIVLILIGEGWILAILFFPLFIFGGIGVLLTIFLFPWPEYPPIPRLGELSTKLKFSPLATFIFLAIPAISLSMFTNKFLFHILSGELFTSQFNSSIIRGALDQSGFNKGIFLLIYFSAQVFPFVAIARWISNRNTRLGYWSFSLPVLWFCVSLLSINTLIFVGLLKYINAMGITPMRIGGLFYGIIAYVILLGYFWWAISPSKENIKIFRHQCKVFSYVFLFVFLLLLPLAGVYFTGKFIPEYLEFPPRLRYVEHAPFSWPVFIGLAIFIITVCLPFIIKVISSKPSSVLRPPSSDSRWPRWGTAGLLFGVIAWILAWNRFAWFADFQIFTFSPLWFSYIVVVNAWTRKRTGRCMMIDRPEFFGMLFLLSAFFWWFFEYLNRFVQNWYYEGIGDLSPFMYFLYATLPFSTVLPAVLGTYDLLESFPKIYLGLNNFIKIKINPYLTAWLILIICAIGLLLIGVYPDFLFPLLWVSPFGIIIAIMTLQKRKTFFVDLADGNWRRIYLLALSALICGFFWELWNYQSLAKWVYEVPFVNRFKIFEMPILGYSGYLPFGLECAVIVDMFKNNYGHKNHKKIQK